MLTLKQVNDKVNQCIGKNWLKEVKTEFDYPHLDLNIQKEGFHDIYQYVARQKRGWDKINIELPKDLSRGKNLFNTLIIELEQFLEDAIKSEEDVLGSLWARRINSRIKSIHQNKMFPIDSPITTFLVDTYKKGLDFYNGAYEYLINKGNMSFNSAHKLSGALMAYEYEFQEATTLPRRRGHEKSSNTRLRNSFEKYFTETQRNVTEFYNVNQKLTDDFSKRINTLFSEKESLFDKWFNGAKEKEEGYNKYSLERAKELEVLYSDKLMLEKPADY